MNTLPNEMLMNILSFLCQSELLLVVSRTYLPVYRSNVVWRHVVTRRFGEIPSSNYFQEYVWQIKVEKHKFSYKRRFTMGCVGRTIPPKKEAWLPAIF